MVKRVLSSRGVHPKCQRCGHTLLWHKRPECVYGLAHFGGRKWCGCKRFVLPRSLGVSSSVASADGGVPCAHCSLVHSSYIKGGVRYVKQHCYY